MVIFRLDLNRSFWVHSLVVLTIQRDKVPAPLIGSKRIGTVKSRGFMWTFAVYWVV